MLTGSGWEWLAEFALAFWVYWVVHAWIYRMIGCSKCEGKGGSCLSPSSSAIR